MKWKNPDELRRLGFWVRGCPGEEDPEVDYELCLADDESAVSYDITISFSKEPAAGKPHAPPQPEGFVYAGAELSIHKLRRELVGGPLVRGPFLAARPLYFGGFRDVEVFLSALTGTTPLFPEDAEPARRETGAQDLLRTALAVLRCPRPR